MRLFFSLPVAGFLIVIFSMNAQAYTFVYDDFSGPSLNTSKWEEQTPDTFPDEHFVNTTNEVYHVAQLSPPPGVGATVHLIMKEGYNHAIIEYDLNYISGSGNHLHNFDIVPHANVDWCPGHCYIGYWNQNGIIGSQKGKYHLKFELNSTDETIFINITKPDGTYWTHSDSLTGEPKPYRFLMQTGTGNNGVMHYEIDNVLVTIPGEPPEPPEPPCNCTELSERIDGLEERVDELEDAECDSRLSDIEDRADLLEAALTTLQESLALLQDSVDAFRGTIITYLTNAPFRTKKEMVCGHMKENDLDEYSALGLDCEIKEFSYRQWTWEYCRCE